MLEFMCFRRARPACKTISGEGSFAGTSPYHVEPGLMRHKGEKLCDHSFDPKLRKREKKENKKSMSFSNQ